MQLHMSKKRHANASMQMELTKKSYPARSGRSSNTTKMESKMNNGVNGANGTTMGSSWTQNQIEYPSAPSVVASSSNTSIGNQARILQGLSAARSSTAIQSELQRIEDEFKRRAARKT